MPALKTIIADAAPKAAPCDTPSVEDEASGLRKILCITQPVTDNPMPATIAVTMRGKRILNTIISVFGEPRPHKLKRTCVIVNLDEPLAIATIPISIVTAARISINSFFRPIYAPYVLCASGLKICFIVKVRPLIRR